MPSFRSLFLILTLCLSLSLALESYVSEDGYEVFPWLNGSRYKLYSFPHTWPEALSLCQGDGGGSHLVIINSEEEANITMELFARITDAKITFLAVGINCVVQPGTWVTTQGDLVSVSGYNSWESSEPDHPGNQHCGMIFRSSLYGSHYCDASLPFICEKNNS